MSIGKKIKDVRKEKGISQLDLAEHLNSSQTIISQYENDIIIPSAFVLKKIASFLKVSADYILELENLALNDTSLLKKFKEIEKLKEEDKKTIIHLVELYLKDLQQKKKNK